jgi:hypothetical protein
MQDHAPQLSGYCKYLEICTLDTPKDLRLSLINVTHLTFHLRYQSFIDCARLAAIIDNYHNL